jgi:hypothetical protein
LLAILALAGLAALLSGSIQAAMTDPPGTLQVEEQGFHPLWDPG